MPNSPQNNHENYGRESRPAPLQNLGGLTRFHLDPSKPLQLNLAQLDQALAPYWASEIQLQDPHAKEQKLGWVPYYQDADPKNSENPKYLDALENTNLSGACSEGYLLKLRIERRKIGASVFQHYYQQSLRKAQAEAALGSSKKLSVPQKQALREEVKQMLLGHALPQVQHIGGFLWQPPSKRKELWIFSASPQAVDLFREFFQKTFSCPLLLLSVPLVGFMSEIQQRGMDKIPADLPLLSQIKPDLETLSR